LITHKIVVEKDFDCPVSNCPHVQNNAAYARGYIRGLANNNNIHNQSSVYDAGYKAGVASVDTLKHYSDGLKAGIMTIDTSQIYVAAFGCALKNLEGKTNESRYEYALAVGYKRGFEDGKNSVNKEYMDSLYDSLYAATNTSETSSSDIK
jgi:hypothetical protein